MAPERSASPRMTPATPVSRRRRRPSRSWTPPATRISASYDRTSSRVRARSGSAPPWVRTNRATPGPDQLADEAVDASAATARRHGNAASRSGRGIEADRQPVAGDGQAGAQVVGPVGDRGRQHDPGRAGGEGEPDRLGRVDAAGDLERDGDPRRDRADRVEVGRRAGARALEVDEVDEPCAQRHEPLGDPVGPVGRRADAGRGARASRRPASGPPSRSIAGMTCTAPVRLPAVEQPAVEADRQRPVAQQRVVEALEAERVAEAALLVGAQPEEERPAEQVRQGIGRPVRVPLDLGAGVRALEAACARPGSRSPRRRSARRDASGRRG